ncbi:MAG: DUF4864 domain-containing protein [Micavibrio aeruginosavorus]|uniref:DUF4864 domain-containing protein n=1 Tax=Micavibrio aeruginosavorus TaxID=349221 RepID=A0A7T5R342_9BACT|nr:MAG: DUF4864 domain-containing protein [Micavibrio aeruginosavorus]
MKSDSDGHYGLALSLLGMALAAFILTRPSQAADNQADYGPFLVVKHNALEVSDKERIQSLIIRQLAAIKERQSDEAYALTTGALHQKYETANQFMSMMRFSRRPIYNHVSYKFLDQAQVQDGTVIQRLEIRHTHGAPATAIFRLQRTPDGEWGIDSLSILEDDEGQET